MMGPAEKGEASVNRRVDRGAGQLLNIIISLFIVALLWAQYADIFRSPDADERTKIASGARASTSPAPSPSFSSA
jgi:hypothetical protein